MIKFLIRERIEWTLFGKYFFIYEDFWLITSEKSQVKSIVYTVGYKNDDIVVHSKYFSRFVEMYFFVIVLDLKNNRFEKNMI